MRHLTLCLPYYMNAGMLTEQFARIRALPPDLLEWLSVMIVDDGSPNGDAQGEEIGCPLTIFKIGVDVRWNQDAARNIAAHHAKGWLLLTDIDHLVPRGTFARIIETKLSKQVVYRFCRETLEANGETTPYHPHPNSWLLHRTTYDRIGGYDERLAGHYGTDADFRDRARRKADIVILPDVLIRVPRSVIPDASTTTYQRKGAPEDVGAIPRLKALRMGNAAWEPLRLSFPYRRIWPC